MSLLDGRQQLPLHDVLNLFIKREHDICAALALRLSSIKPALPRVRHHHDLFALAANLAIELVLDSRKPFFIGIDETQNVRRQITLRIKSLVLVLEINAFEIQRFDGFHFVWR